MRMFTRRYQSSVCVFNGGPVLPQVNRSLRAPISSQLIFMPGNTATAAVATVTQQPQAQQQQQEVTPSSSASSQLDNDQVCGINDFKGELSASFQFALRYTDILIQPYSVPSLYVPICRCRI